MERSSKAKASSYWFRPKLTSFFIKRIIVAF
jgi:hypothetical protein